MMIIKERLYSIVVTPNSKETYFIKQLNAGEKDETFLKFWN